MARITLQKPAPWNGDSSELELPLENLTGLDIVKAEDQRDALRSGSRSQVLYALAVAAVALKRPLEDVAALPAQDCNRIAVMVLDFLAGEEGEPSAPEA
jgi:hypothetical protein